MKINQRNDLIEKYEIYKSLLKEKQQEVFELYYYEDESINEIAEVIGITKNGVFNALKKVEKQLVFYEDNLKIIAKYQENIHLLENNNIDKTIIDKIQ